MEPCGALDALLTQGFFLNATAVAALGAPVVSYWDLSLFAARLLKDWDPACSFLAVQQVD
jgi:hypothetical protein